MGGEAHHEITDEDGGAFAAVKAQGRLANTAGVEPSPSLGANASLTGVTVVGTERGTVVNLKPAFVLRPHCQHPEACGGYSDKHCHACTSALKTAPAPIEETV